MILTLRDLTVVELIGLCHPKFCGTDPVIVAAPTGVAARNVNRYTMHSIFNLPVQKGFEPNFHEVSVPVLKNLRERFGGVHTIVIDEIFMVSPTTFNFVHRRLCAIADSSEPFGGYNVCFWWFLSTSPSKRSLFIYRQCFGPHLKRVFCGSTNGRKVLIYL